MFGNLKLRGRIFIGFSIPVVLVFCFGGIVYVIGNQVADTFKKINTAQRALIATDEMVLTNSLMARQARGYLLVKSQDPLNELEKQRQRYQRAAEAAAPVITDPDQKKVYNQMVQSGKQFDRLVKETIGLVDRGKQKEAVNKYLFESKVLIGGIDNLNS